MDYIKAMPESTIFRKKIGIFSLQIAKNSAAGSEKFRCVFEEIPLRAQKNSAAGVVNELSEASFQACNGCQNFQNAQKVEQK